MKHFSVEITEPAVEDIRRLWMYIAVNLNDPKAASMQRSRILSAAEALAVFPKIYRVRKYDSKGRALRYFPVNNYVIIYVIDEEKQIVDILNVIYGKRDIDSLI